MRVSNLFGISREGRAQGTEIGMFLQEIQGSEFKEYSKYDIKYCIKEIEDVIYFLFTCVLLPSAFKT